MKMRRVMLTRGRYIELLGQLKNPILIYYSLSNTISTIFTRFTFHCVTLHLLQLIPISFEAQI